MGHVSVIETQRLEETVPRVWRWSWSTCDGRNARQGAWGTLQLATTPWATAPRCLRITTKTVDLDNSSSFVELLLPELRPVQTLSPESSNPSPPSEAGTITLPSSRSGNWGQSAHLPQMSQLGSSRAKIWTKYIWVQNHKPLHLVVSIISRDGPNSYIHIF